MILASIRSTRRELAFDGELVVVHPSRKSVALLPQREWGSLLEALSCWGEREQGLRDIDAQVRAGTWKEMRPAAEVSFLAPLPRTWAFLDGSAFIEHVKLVRKARGADLPEDLLTIPLMYQGASDNLLAPTGDIPLVDPAHGMDFESEVAVITDGVPMGTTAAHAAPHVKLIVLVNDISLRELIPRELGTGFGFFHGKPPSSLAPFAVTPDELGSAWHDGRVHLPLETLLNGARFGAPDAGQMHFSFFQLIEHAAKTRPLSPGTIIGSGTVSNEDASAGASCLVEQRMREKIATGAIKTQYLRDGDRVSIRMMRDGVSIFGTIEQRVRQAP